MRTADASAAEVYSYEQRCMMDLSDNYTLLYAFIGRALISKYGTEGERALREGLRRYGRDRGLASRERHLKAGFKVNMRNLFSVMFDLPGDPRFERELQELNEEERVSHTLVCPMADIWKEYGMREIGRMYCEEFHPACYNHYAFDYGVTNLAKTLTQECDDYCDFNVVLRKANVPPELLPQCFEEEDPGYVRPDPPSEEPTGKEGFETLSIKLYYYILEAALEIIGPEASAAVGEGLASAGADGRARAERTAVNYGKEFGREVIRDTYPISADPFDEELWSGYKGGNSMELIRDYLAPALLV